MKTRLYASSGTLENITKLINKFYYTTTIELKSKTDTEWEISNSKGLLPTVRVIFKKNRYRFEAILNMS